MAVEAKRTGMLLIISGPSGTGKGTLVGMLKNDDDRFRFSCSVTTREKRTGEIHGVHYYFISDEEYDRLLAEDAFLEHAAVHTGRYGTLRSEVDRILAEGHNVILDVDVQGAINIMNKVEDYVSVFILPPSFSELRRRLIARETNTPEEIEGRMQTAYEEIKLVDRYNYSIVNDDLEKAYAQLRHIVEGEKQNTKRCKYTIPE